MKRKSKSYWIQQLDLLPHPEGGYYRETYRSDLQVNLKEFESKRSVSTGIYFLIDAAHFSAFHRIKSDEMWHFYGGDPLKVHMIFEDGSYSYQVIGEQIDHGEQLQFVVPKNTWFASEVNAGGDYSLVGCTVSPGFDFKDFEMAKQEELSRIAPNYQHLIQRLCRQ